MRNYLAIIWRYAGELKWISNRTSCASISFANRVLPLYLFVYENEYGRGKKSSVTKVSSFRELTVYGIYNKTGLKAFSLTSTNCLNI